MQYNEQNHVKGGVLFLFFQSATDCVKLFFLFKKKKSQISYKPLPIEKRKSIFSFDLTVG